MSRMTSAKAIRYALSGVLAAGLLAGCAGSSHLARAGDHAVRASGKLDRAVDTGELAVEASPNDASARLALAQAYLEAGRFQSAATTFQDAIKLGDTSGGTQLRLALAQIGAGNSQAAVPVLDAARDSIPASDRGLALALAGETTRGVGVLSDALRAGENSPKLRQNLAYAFALDGRWREARLAMAQDVSPEQIDDRIGEWAMMAQPEAIQRRVATMLGVPAGVADAGQPIALALGGAPQAERLAVAETQAPVSAAPVVPPGAAELPAVDQAPAPVAPAPAVAAPVPMMAAAAPSAPAPLPESFAAAFAPQPGFVSQPVVQRTPVPIATPRPRAVRPLVASAPRPAPVPTGSSHMVQLGSFSSEANAHRAVRIFAARNPELRGFRLVITPAVVNGRNFWRVAATGFDGNGARRLCSDLRNRGGACFAYAATRTLLGSKPALAMAGR